MNALRLALIVLLASPIAAACGKSDCEKAIDKEIECEPDEDRKKEMKESKDIAVAFCKGDKSDDQKARLDCYKKDTCEEVKSCEDGLRAAEDAKRITESIEKGDYDSAISSCTWDVENYKAVPEFKAVCDKAITEGFSKLEDPSWKCRGGDDFLAESDTLEAECKKLGDGLKTKIEAARDAGADDDYSTCSSYKDIVAATAPDQAKAAELLCKEMSAANYAKAALDECKANLAKKEADIPFQTTSFLDTKEMDGSDWFKTRSAEVARACFGDLGKIALAEMGSFCGYAAQQVHEYAPRYKLGDGDPELKALLEKTAAKCKK